MVAGVVPVGRRMAVPCKTEKIGGGQKGWTRCMGCSPAIESSCGGRAWWRWSALTAEEISGRSWRRGRLETGRGRVALAGVG
jgi:hypothetical protein